jgi:hypothetical protein
MRAALMVALVVSQAVTADPGVTRDGDYARLYAIAEDQLVTTATDVARDTWVLTSTNRKAGVVSFTTAELYVTVRIGAHKSGRTRVRVDSQMKSPGMFSMGRGKRIAEAFFERLEARLRASSLLPAPPDRDWPAGAGAGGGTGSVPGIMKGPIP